MHSASTFCIGIYPKYCQTYPVRCSTGAPSLLQLFYFLTFDAGRRLNNQIRCCRDDVKPCSKHQLCFNFCFAPNLSLVTNVQNPFRNPLAVPISGGPLHEMYFKVGLRQAIIKTGIDQAVQLWDRRFLTLTVKVEVWNLWYLQITGIISMKIKLWDLAIL